MGAWGEGVFDNDTALDVQNLFEEMLLVGDDVETATKRVINDMLLPYDEEETPDLYLALAALQIEHKALQPDIRDIAIEIITTGQGLFGLEEEYIQERKRVLQRLYKQLLNPNNSGPATRTASKSWKARKSPKVKERVGDVFAIPLEEGVVAVGIVLWISKEHKGADILGVYNQTFNSLEEINLSALPQEFIMTPNYYIPSFQNGQWKIIGNRPELLIDAKVPQLIDGFSIRYKDEYVRQASDADFDQIPRLSIRLAGSLEHALRKHFIDGCIPIGGHTWTAPHPAP